MLACAAAFAGRAPTTRSLLARAPGRMTDATAAFWAERWKRLLAPPAGRRAARRAARAATCGAGRTCRPTSPRDERQLAELLASTDGQILTTLPGVAAVRAAAFSAYTLPIERWPTPEHLYSATGLAPATYQSSTVTRRGRISRQGLPEHRDALMGIAWGLSHYSPAFKRARRASSAPAASARSRPASRSPATPAGCAGACFTPNSPTTIGVTIAPGSAGGDGLLSYAARRRNLACRPPAQPLLTAHTKACRTTAPDQPADPAAAARAHLIADSSQTPRSPTAAMTHGHHRP